MKKSILSLVVVTMFATVSSHAAVVFGNLGANGTDGIRGAGVTNTVNARNLTVYDLAQGFTVSSPGWTVNSATVGLVGNGSIKLSLFSDLAGNPGTELVSQTLSINQAAVTPGTIPGTTFSFAPVSLATGSYWIVASKVSGDTNRFTWTLANSFAPTNLAPATMVQQNGSGWTYTGSKIQPVGGGVWSNASSVTGNGAYASLSIDASPIPEPGTWAAMAIFAGGAAYVGWRRRQQQAA